MRIERRTFNKLAVASAAATVATTFCAASVNGMPPSVRLVSDDAHCVGSAPGLSAGR